MCLKDVDMHGSGCWGQGGISNVLSGGNVVILSDEGSSQAWESNNVRAMTVQWVTVLTFDPCLQQLNEFMI